MPRSSSSSSSASSTDSDHYAQMSLSDKGKDLACDGGFIYCLDKRRDTKYYWNCVQARGSGKCRARLVTELVRERSGDRPPKHRIVRTTKGTPHNHPPSPTHKMRKDALVGLKRKAAGTMDRPANIIQSTQTGISVDAAAGLPSQDALRRRIKRARRAVQAAEPQSLGDVSIPEELTKTLEGENFLLAHYVEGDANLLVFSTLSSMHQLGRARMLIMDGTFKSCPILYRQIYTIHGMVGDRENRKTVPLVYCLMSSKRESLYRKLFDTLIEYCTENEIDLAPRYILTDFEMSVINAIRIKFPDSSHRGCMFHLGQIVYRNVQSRGLARIYGRPTSEFATQVRQLVALAFLTPEEIPVAFRLIKQSFDVRGIGLLEWFERYYITGYGSGRARRPPRFPPSMWSVADLMESGLPRTQNSLEAWHRRFNSLGGGNHLGVLSCVSLFRDEQHSTKVIIERLSRGFNVPMESALRQREDRIRAVYEDKANRETLDFLTSLAHNIKFAVVVHDDREGSDDEDE